MALINPIQLQKFLKGINYPADKNTIMETAKRNGADQNVMNTLGNLPEREYGGPVGISEEIGKME